VGNRRIAQELEKGALYGLKQLYIFIYSLYWAQVRVFPIDSNRKKGRLACLNISKMSQCNIKVCRNPLFITDCNICNLQMGIVSVSTNEEPVHLND
jgi:hypothetical protein